jgi:DNA-binding transcriptional ArsR family regulator
MTEGFKEIAQIDKVIHEPARLAIMAILSSCESADFSYLAHATQLTHGNLSGHLRRLEEAGYLVVHKGYNGRIPQTTYSLKPKGVKAFTTYWEGLKEFVRQVEN